MSTFDAPPPASANCRHYSYTHGDGADRGPACARGVDLKARKDTRPCMPPAKAHGLFEGNPGPLGLCTWRADYTAAECAAWDAYMEARAMRFITALASLPPIDEGGGDDMGSQPCPNCRDGSLRWSRGRSHAHLECTTPNCTGPITYRKGQS